MAEVKKRIRAYRLRYTCDECDKGEMEWTGRNEIRQDTSRGLFCFKGHIHRCDKCTAEATLDNCYPQRVEEEERGE